ncbi:MAG: acetate--CoA ligase family protein [Actinomycetota bacterium]
MTTPSGPSRSDLTALEPMLEARSVAVVGASVKEGSLGNQMVVELRRGGYEGEIYPVNPGYEEVLGLRCYPSIAKAPGDRVDLAILGVANHRIEQAVCDAIEAGARSLVTFSSLYEAEPPERGMPPLTQRVAAMLRDAGVPMCGGNGMGFFNETHRLRATGFASPDELRHGPVTFLSHSGSAFAALAFNDRGIGFNLLVSSGQELGATMADYMAYALGRPETKVLALLLETVRDPEGFRAQLERAAELGVPVIALKVGRTEAAKSMVTAHSGALAGEHGAFEALFDACGVHEVVSLEEMADAMELFSSPRRVTGGRGLSALCDSGGERALLVDRAHDLGVPFAAISQPTLDTLDQTLDPGLVAANPLDAWGTGFDSDRIFRESLMALHDDPETAALAFVVDLTRQGEPYDAGYLQIAKDVFAATTKPFCMLTNLASAVEIQEAAYLRDAGIPVLEGTSSGLVAIRALLDDGAPPRQGGKPPALVADEVRVRWRERLATGNEVGELEGLALLADYGVPVTEARAASSSDEAVAAAEAIGFPVVLKTAAPSVQHKSDVGGVKVALADADSVRAAYQDVAARLGPQVAIGAMAPAGIEIALGIVRDPTFGPLVLVAAGGILVELLHDRALAFPPLDEAGARRLVDRLKIRPMLDGLRGAEPSDVDALVHAVSRLSVLAADLGDLLSALDVNPVIVSPTGCVAVDALVAP